MEKLVEAMKKVNDLNKSHGVVQRGGKKYTEVAVRIEAFRTTFGIDLGIDTLVLVDDGKRVVVKSIITDAGGRILGSGMAEEIRGSSNVNKTSALENCETSAIGRALASLGLHGGTYASANEMVAVARKEAAQAEPQKPAIPMPPGFPDPSELAYKVVTHEGNQYKQPVHDVDDAAALLVDLMKVYAKAEKNRSGEEIGPRERMTMIRKLREANEDWLADLPADGQERLQGIYKKILAALGAQLGDEA